MDVADSDMLARYRQGDVDALEQLMARHHRMLYGYIVNMTAGQDGADDIYQEVWLKVIKKLDGYRNNNFPGWLVRIAHNAVIDRVRKKRPEISLDQENDGGHNLGQTLVAGDPAPSANLDAGALGQQIAAAVARLPRDQREVFLMRAQANLSFKEIARIQRVSINTALARMQYALTKLRPLLHESYAELSGYRETTDANRR
ncbi:MAG: sigma-70 family RNA polymerase sigma factor [Verrucomicrobia bacterium]|nr:sigma-70 family RNA polymerase sigma factor [Verrucomicrobiota bacterium]